MGISEANGMSAGVERNLTFPSAHGRLFKFKGSIIILFVSFMSLSPLYCVPKRAIYLPLPAFPVLLWNIVLTLIGHVASAAIFYLQGIGHMS